jgi:hypothetical protein
MKYAVKSVEGKWQVWHDCGATAFEVWNGCSGADSIDRTLTSDRREAHAVARVVGGKVVRVREATDPAVRRLTKEQREAVAKYVGKFPNDEYPIDIAACIRQGIGDF